MPKFSIVVPVYNRPDEIAELLGTLVDQSYKDFEVIVVEDGSTTPCSEVVQSYADRLDIKYFTKPNEGQGFARNFGYSKASGDYFIVFDSDCLIPGHYLQSVDDELKKQWVDAYGGPDTFHESFSILQKAISHTMTSSLTTGGMRGGKVRVSGFHPRSFNMGISQEVFQKTKGYRIPFMGEDMEFSKRILSEGFKTALFPDAFVYHKRRTSLVKFSKQLKYFGRARINLTRFHQDQLKLIHFLPIVFVLGTMGAIILSLMKFQIGFVGLGILVIYFLMVVIDGIVKTKSIGAGLVSPIVVLIQFFSYSYGLLYEWIRKLRGIDPNTPYIDIY
ncbi:MAG: glycosyltransferase [Bacteroidota bacterium]